MKGNTNVCLAVSKDRSKGCHGILGCLCAVDGKGICAALIFKLNLKGYLAVDYGNSGIVAVGILKGGIACIIPLVLPPLYLSVVPVGLIVRNLVINVRLISSRSDKSLNALTVACGAGLDVLRIPEVEVYPRVVALVCVSVNADLEVNTVLNIHLVLGLNGDEGGTAGPVGINRCKALGGVLVSRNNGGLGSTVFIGTVICRGCVSSPLTVNRSSGNRHYNHN